VSAEIEMKTEREQEKYLQKRIKEEDEWIYKNLNCPKAIFLSMITLGFYRIGKIMEYTRRVGLI